MTKNRVEAFSDGVIAIIITMMVPELRVPHDASPGRNSNESFVLLWGIQQEDS
jgi:uncharacterized membrane protein